MKTNVPRSARIHPPCRPCHAECGIALLVTLVFLVIITILVVGFTVSMRTERMASNSMAENERCKLLARSALANATSLLVNNIPDPGDPTVATPANAGRNWYSNPGRLTVISSAGTNNIPLYSGAATSTNSLVAVNLNAALPSEPGKYPITGSPDPMWVSWINVLEDPTSPASASNKLLGRYAFWIDDESTKINVNVARGKPDTTAPDSKGIQLKLPNDWGSAPVRDLWPYIGMNFMIGSKTYGVTHPAAINLSAVGVTNAKIATLESDIAGNGFLTAPEAAIPYFDSVADFESQKFNITVFSRSPEFNVFGKSRIFLTKWAGNTVAGAAYQHTYHPEQPMTFYVRTMGLTTAEANNLFIPAREVQKPVISALARYLERSDWPGMEGKKFRWTSAGPEESDQIAVNINSEVFMALNGSPGGQGSGATGNNVCDDLDRKFGTAGDFSPYTGPQGNFWQGSVSGKGMIGRHPFPMISEMGIRLSAIQSPKVAPNNKPTDPYPTTFQLVVEVLQEFYLAPGYFRDSGTGTGPWTNTSGTAGYQQRSLAPYVNVVVSGPGVFRTNTAKDGSVVSFGGRTLAAGPSVDGYMYASRSRVLKKTDGEFTTSGGSPQNLSKSGTYTVTVRMRSGCGDNSQGLLASEMAPFPIPAAQSASGSVPAGLLANPESEGYLEFTMQFNGADADDIILDPTLGPTLTYEIDDPRNYYKKSSWKTMEGELETNTLGQPNSIAHSSVDASRLSKFAMWNPYGSGASGAIGMLSFVPTGMQRGIPWDTLQFHSYAPGSNELPDWLVLDLVAPYYGAPISLRNSTAGKLNLNSKIYPEEVPGVFEPPQRIKPLQALFMNMPNAGGVADAIANWQSASNGFDHVGRVTQVAGVADATQGVTDFEKEVLIRNLAGMMTTQSNTFGVWGVAQTVKKSPGSSNYGSFESGDSITGEKRFYAVVERYVWSGKDGVGGNGAADSGTYYALASGGTDTTKSPGMPPTSGFNGSDIFGSKVKTSAAGFVWPPVDGPQQPQLDIVHGTTTYTPTPAKAALNPLAALMKYRVIYFTYIQ